MTDDELFNFAIPWMPAGDTGSPEEIEARLVENLKKQEQDYQAALWELARFHVQMGRQPRAVGLFERLLAVADDPELRAKVLLTLGQLMEQMNEHEAAIPYYTQAFSLEPQNTPTWYLINNNLGFCLNKLGRFSEGESYCRHAIGIDPARQNAYKNLGISLAGQGAYAQAAGSYIKATHANAADERALQLLQLLFAEHPEIALDIPDIQEQISKCQEAVQAVAEYRRKRSAGWSPGQEGKSEG